MQFLVTWHNCAYLLLMESLDFMNSLNSQWLSLKQHFLCEWVGSSHKYSIFAEYHCHTISFLCQVKVKLRNFLLRLQILLWSLHYRKDKGQPGTEPAHMLCERKCQYQMEDRGIYIHDVRVTPSLLNGSENWQWRHLCV